MFMGTDCKRLLPWLPKSYFLNRSWVGCRKWRPHKQPSVFSLFNDVGGHYTLTYLCYIPFKNLFSSYWMRVSMLWRIERRSVTSRYHGSTISPRASLRHETFWFQEPALWSRWTHTKIVDFFFDNLDNDRYSPKENFAKIKQIKWNWIRSVKFKIVRIDF